MNQRGCICVFAKPPVVGRVKTRLISRLGKTGAAQLATVFLQDTWAAVSVLPWAKAVVASTEEGLPVCPGDSVEIWLQGEGNLGVRLASIFRRALGDHPYAIAIGADSPGLPSMFLEQAREALTRMDAVIGPCEDGGFYLLGLRRCPANLLSGISWSTATTCQETISQLKAAGLAVHILDSWFDVDTAEDLQKLESKILANQIHAPRTKDFLEVHASARPTAHAIKFSVIIPTLNEREYLPQTIAVLEKQEWIHEVIVADGGSTDGTREWLSAQNFARVVDSPPSKGIQLNRGAQAANGDVFLILHADCQLLPEGAQHLVSVLQSQEVAGGCFEIRFTANRPRSLGLVAAGINFRTRLTHTATGDQGIFVRRPVFEQIGGGPDWPLFEDVELARRIKKRGRFVVIRSPLLISPRRYLARGVFRTVLLIFGLRFAFWLGVSPFTLKKWFDDSRPPARPLEIQP